jgi:hypothetical protein
MIGRGQTQRGPASRVVPSSGRPGEPHSLQHGAVAVKRATRVCELGRQQSLARDLLEQKLKFAAVDPLTGLVMKSSGVVYQLGERAPGALPRVTFSINRTPLKY